MATCALHSWQRFGTARQISFRIRGIKRFVHFVYADKRQWYSRQSITSQPKSTHSGTTAIDEQIPDAKHKLNRQRHWPGQFKSTIQSKYNSVRYIADWVAHFSTKHVTEHYVTEHIAKRINWKLASHAIFAI
jgi:hypothetical protein